MAYWKYIHHYSNLVSFTPSPSVCSSSIYRSRPNLARAGQCSGSVWRLLAGMEGCSGVQPRRRRQLRHHHSSPQCVTGHRALPTYMLIRAQHAHACSCMMIHDTCYLQWHICCLWMLFLHKSTSQNSVITKQATFDAQMFPIKPKALMWPFNPLIQIDL